MLTRERGRMSAQGKHSLLLSERVKAGAFLIAVRDSKWRLTLHAVPCRSRSSGQQWGRWYIGKVSTFDAKSGKHTVQFKDGDKREYTMRHEAVVWLDVPGIDGASAAARLEPGWQDEEVCILACAPLRNQSLPCAYTADSSYGCWAVTQSLQQPGWNWPAEVASMPCC